MLPKTAIFYCLLYLTNLLRHLIESSRAFGVDFVFSVSPGLDLIYSSDADLRQLLDKFEELQKLGNGRFDKKKSLNILQEF